MFIYNTRPPNLAYTFANCHKLTTFTSSINVNSINNRDFPVTSHRGRLYFAVGAVRLADSSRQKARHSFYIKLQASDITSIRMFISSGECVNHDNFQKQCQWLLRFVWNEPGDELGRQDLGWDYAPPLLAKSSESQTGDISENKQTFSTKHNVLNIKGRTLLFLPANDIDINISFREF